MIMFFFFNDTATTEIYTLSLHDALPICARRSTTTSGGRISRTRTTNARSSSSRRPSSTAAPAASRASCASRRSEEHTSELQSRQYLVCRLLLEKTKKIYIINYIIETLAQ